MILIIKTALMKEITEQILSDLHEAEAYLGAALSDVPDEITGVRINDSTWSIADIIVHLAMIETSVYMIAKKNPAAESKLHDSLTIIGRDKLREGLLDRTHKVKLPEAVANRMETLPIKTALERLTKARNLNKELLRTNAILSPNLIVPHPVLGDMTKIDWLITVPFHSMRHTEQIHEIKKLLLHT